MNSRAQAVNHRPQTIAENDTTSRELSENAVYLPEKFNYIGIFLTFRCPYTCSFCINNFRNNKTGAYKEIPGKEWINFFKRLKPGNVPITLQGGEPGVHKDFISIVEETSRIHSVDILTNLAFDLDEFINRIDPELINRDAPYAPIRVSYHPSQFTLDEIVEKIGVMTQAGFRMGLYGVTHPSQMDEIETAAKTCRQLNIDFRTKEFLGYHNGKLYGQYAYPDACTLKTPKSCECSPSELLIAPDGSIYPCHHHIYNKVESCGHIRNKKIELTTEPRSCPYYGHCNPCDVKIKNNRFQQFGHVSVKIRNVTQDT